MRGAGCSSDAAIRPDRSRFMYIDASILMTREFPTWEGGGESREPSVARLVR